MDQELKSIFTRRISVSNKAELVVIIYDIYFAHTDYARKQKKEDDREGFKESLRRAADAQSELIRALDMQYQISGNLRVIYDYCRRLVYKTMAEGKLEYLDESDHLMGLLKVAFTEAAKQDNSEPMMQNAQTVYAGFTYGKGSLNENYIQTANRGFFA